MGSTKSKQNLTDHIIKHFRNELVSVIAHQSFLLKQTKNEQKKLLLVFNNSFNFKSFSTIVNTDKELSKLYIQNLPLIFTEEEIINSCDIFPIEFYDILATSEVLFGKNLKELIEIKDINLRLQIESNLRRNIILLRQDFFIRKKELPLLLNDSLNNVLMSLNNLLRLKASFTEGLNPRQILLKISEFLSINVESFFAIIREWETPPSKKKKNPIDWSELFNNYLNELVILIKEVDSLVV